MAHDWEKSLLDKGLQCPICIDFFNEPLTLACSHSFCRLCLLQSTRLAPDGRRCPECRAPIEIEDPLGHLTNPALEGQLREAIPAEALATRKSVDSQQLEGFLHKEKNKLPIFYMPGVASRAGQAVSLHFFEPRYRILIRRAWEGSRRFLCTSSTPRNGDQGLVVHIEDASFLPDGRANLQGRGIEVVTLANVWVEDGTEGLYYADVPTQTPAPDVTQVSENQVRQALMRAIREGAPAYNRGEIELCVQLYSAVAEKLLQRAASTEIAASLEGALQNARACGQDHDRAAWALRRAFDAILDRSMLTRLRSQQGSAAGAALALSGEQTELAVFQMDACPSARTNLAFNMRFFEPRYRILARETWARQDRLFIYGASALSGGDRAMLIHVEQCSFNEQGDANIRGTSVAVVNVTAFRRDAAKGGLAYAKCIVPEQTHGSIVMESRTANTKAGCCSIQ